MSPTENTSNCYNPLPKRQQRTSLLALLALLALGLTITCNTAFAWSYLAAGYNTSTGKPNSMTDLSLSTTPSPGPLPSNLVSTILARLPEGQPIGNNAAALALLTDDAGANIFFKGDVNNVSISYVTEGAGYLNSVGYFKFKTDQLNTLTLPDVAFKDTIMFPNFSDTILQFGKTVNLGPFKTGDALGFTIIANGWLSASGVVDPNKSPNKIFRTIKRLNPETESSGTSNLKAHTILLADYTNKLLVLGFEDLNRQSGSFNDYGYGSDNDFNDVVIAIRVDPWEAIDCTNCDPIIAPPTTPVTCTAPKVRNANTNTCICPSTMVLNSATNLCETPPIVCTAPQIRDAATNTCVVPAPTPPVCVLPQVLNTTTNTCETPPVVCTTPKVRDANTNTCVCQVPQLLNATTNQCETPPVVCTAPQVRDAATNTCVSTVSGEDGAISWREITSPTPYADTLADSKKTTKAARDAAKAANKAP